MANARAFISLGLLALLFILVFAIFLIYPRTPPSPLLSAEAVVHHCHEIKIGAQVGIMCMQLAAALWPIYSTAISTQLARIPGVSPLALGLQVCTGGLVGVAMMVIAIVWAVLMYRLDRDPQLTVLLHDFAWITFSMATPPWFSQEIAITYLILSDTRRRPLIPRWLAWLCSLASVVMLPGLGVHMSHRGPLAWNGGITFWFISFAGFSQHILLIIYLWRAAGISDTVRFSLVSMFPYPPSYAKVVK
jgi:hypothetical protein